MQDVRLEHDVSRGILVSSSTLTLRELTLSHNGAYSCLVRNTVGEVRSPAVEIRMKCKYTPRETQQNRSCPDVIPLFHFPDVPRCKEGQESRDIIAATGETLRLQCQIEADPRDNVRYSWTRNSSLGDVSAVTNPRPTSSSLEYVARADEDFGTLACWASNSVGRQKSPCTFNLVPASELSRSLLMKFDGGQGGMLGQLLSFDIALPFDYAYSLDDLLMRLRGNVVLLKIPTTRRRAWGKNFGLVRVTSY